MQASKRRQQQKRNKHLKDSSNKSVLRRLLKKEQGYVESMHPSPKPPSDPAKAKSDDEAKPDAHDKPEESGAIGHG